MRATLSRERRIETGELFEIELNLASQDEQDMMVDVVLSPPQLPKPFRVMALELPLMWPNGMVKLKAFQPEEALPGSYGWLQDDNTGIQRINAVPANDGMTILTAIFSGGPLMSGMIKLGQLVFTKQATGTGKIGVGNFTPEDTEYDYWYATIYGWDRQLRSVVPCIRELKISE